MTPRWESIRPMSIGNPSSSYVSAVMIFVADIRRISSGLNRANLIAWIRFVTPSGKTSSHVLQLEAHDDSQREEFVKQELERVRCLHGIDLRRVLADRTPKVPFPIFDRKVSAVRVPADILDRPVRLVEEAILDHHCGAVANQTVPLHLAESQPALTGPPFGRLPREDLDRSAGTDVQLARDHVVQLLVVDHPDEDLGRDHAARAAVVQDLLPVRPEAVFLEGLPHGVLPLTGERRAIDEPSFEATD